jgi:hypothetical protein
MDSLRKLGKMNFLEFLKPMAVLSYTVIFPMHLLISMIKLASEYSKKGILSLSI